MYSKEAYRQLKHDFWNQFDNYTRYYSRKKGEPIKWMLYKTGIKGLELKFDIDSKYVIVALELNHRNENRCFDMFVLLDAYKSILTQNMPIELIWDEKYLLPEGKEVKRIYCKYEKLSFHNPDNWPVIYAFMAENMWLLQQNLQDILPIMQEEFGRFS
jgi:hypothetical protein